MAVGGHSAGAHLAAGAAMMLKERGVRLALQMLVYPCLDLASTNLEGIFDMVGPFLFPQEGEREWTTKHRWASPHLATDEELADLPPAIFIECGPDFLKPMGIQYAKRLIDLGIPIKIKEYPLAEHGFLEVNRPEYPDGDDRKTPEQAIYCNDCERYLVAELRASLLG